MNPLATRHGDSCDRCDDPLGLQRFVVKVDSDPALTDPIEVLLCDRCMDSLSRWMQRRKEGRIPPSQGERTNSPPSRSKRDRRSNRFADVLDREESRARLNRRILIVGTLLLFALMIGLLYSAVVSDVLRDFRGRKPPEMPGLRVDPTGTHELK